MIEGYILFLGRSSGSRGSNAWSEEFLYKLASYQPSSDILESVPTNTTTFVLSYDAVLYATKPLY